MGLFDKFKKVAKESMQATGIADVLQKQADDVRLAMKYGVTATPKNLEIAREKEAAERKAKEEAERRAQEEAERKAELAVDISLFLCAMPGRLQGVGAEH